MPDVPSPGVGRPGPIDAGPAEPRPVEPRPIDAGPVDPAPPDRRGLAAGLGAYFLWGLLPVYIAALSAAGPLEIVAHRAAWSLALCLVILALTRTLGQFAAVWRDRRATGVLAVAAVLVAVNWLTYVYAIDTERAVDASLGYYLNPLVTVLLGVGLLHERLRPAQWVALGLGALAVVVLGVSGSSAPWIAVALAVSFALYGLAKKRVSRSVAPLPGMAVETTVLLLPAVGYLGWLAAAGQGAMGPGGPHGGLPPGVLDALLVGTGLMTTAPLLLFAVAARRLPLSTVGLLQFLAPTLQFLVAILVFHEPMPPMRWVGFGIVWLAVAVLSVDMVGAARRAGRPRVRRSA